MPRRRLGGSTMARYLAMRTVTFVALTAAAALVLALPYLLP